MKRKRKPTAAHNRIDRVPFRNALRLAFEAGWWASFWFEHGNRFPQLEVAMANFLDSREASGEGVGPDEVMRSISRAAK